MATLKVPATVPAVADDCEQLRKAFEGWGTNEELIISILGHRDAAQRRAIRRAYAERSTARSSSAPSPTRSPAISRQAYHDRFKHSLEEDVAAHATGDFRKLFLVPLVTAYRYEGQEVNTRLAHSEAKILHEKIHHKYSDDEIIRILTTRSKAQLLATFNYYNDEYGHRINKDLKADPKDEFLQTLRAVIRCFTCPERYFEKVARQAIAGLGTDENALTRVITTRAEVDLKLIAEAYQKRNSVPLERAVAGDTSGDYERLLLALLGQE
ncbi:hypothetical protein PR202_gb17454 [Eleusine coracana subsp. coracana]|uniref:Annexin n=1 Tax=Eleusine coracana subsp. coracana TaxID=191504 RepID=A0AAV5F0L4_ELECO|nr:hypothetical protein PR202_gb17454 [Eleusine coracana subsp. coracana]